MSLQSIVKSLLALLFVFGVSNAVAQAYGTPMNLESAKKAAAAAVAEARKNNWNMIIAITDPNGDLIYLERMDNAQIGGVRVAFEKARSAARFKRSTKVFQDGVAAGGAGLRILGLHGAVPLDGGLLILKDGKIVGAIGVSGHNGDQDAQCAKAGVDALN